MLVIAFTPPKNAASKSITEDTTKAQILLDDGAATLREPLAKYLFSQGFGVTEAISAAAARAFLNRTAPGIVLFDVMMQGEDSLSLCRRLVGTQKLPVIFLTARSEPADRNVGLELDTDDDIAGPFEPREPVARIRTVLRRIAREPSSQTQTEDWQYSFEGWTLDPLKRKLSDPEGVRVPISTAEFRLLRAFLGSPRVVLDRDRLLDIVQGRTAHLFDRAVYNQVSRLRRRTEADTRSPPTLPRLIQTVRRGGYRFAAQAFCCAGQTPCPGNG